MANVKISALPSYTGSAADLRWFVMNNSGETTTYKYSGYTSGVRPVSGFPTSFITLNYIDSNIACPYSLILGGENNSIAASYFVGRNTIIGGEGNTIPAGFGNMILNGSAASIVGNAATIIGASGSITDGFGNILLGGSGQVGGNNSGIVAGSGNLIGSTYNDRCFIGGGQSNQILYGADCSIIGGTTNTIQGAALYSSIIGGQNNNINGGTHSSIIGGSGNTITGNTNAVMIGCSGRTALYNNTVHVDNSHTFLTESFKTINIGNVGGNINVNCSLGTIFQFTMTANTTPNFINLREGQRIIFSIINNGSFTVPTATVDGVSTVVLAKGGAVNPTNNGITLYYATWMFGNLYLDQHLNFQPI